MGNRFLQLLLIYILYFALCTLQFSSFAQTNETGSFVYNGNVRDYIIHLPPSPGCKLPLVFNLHGYNQNASLHQFYTQMDAVADTAGFIVVYPNAVGGVWDTIYPNSPVDDAGFISALIDTLANNYSIDITRVYSTGLSMGGYMTYRLACELNNRIAAVASVAGPIPNDLLFYCDPVPPIPVLHIHGTADSTVAYQGDLFFASVDTLIQYFVQKNNCLASPDSFQFPDINTADSCTVTKYHYGFCDDSTEVLLYKILNGGHTWPGGLVDIPSLGNTNRDINANAEIWNFFIKHRLDTTISSAITVDSTTTVLAACGVANGSISVYTGGGTPPLLFSIDTGTTFQQGNTFNNLSAGFYSVIIIDSNSCTTTIFVVLDNITAPAISIDSAINVSCNGYTDGNIAVSSSGGVPPYQYSIDGGPFQADSSFFGLMAGSYLITVKDANGCIRSISQTITEPDLLAGILSSTNESSPGTSDGTASVLMSGGSIPYTYSWSPGSQTTNSISGLTSGVYTVTVTDANGCAFIDSVPVNTSVGIERSATNEHQSLIVYPNPFSDNINVEINTQGVKNLTIFNLLGEKIFELNSGRGSVIPPGTYMLSTGHLENGIYFLRLKTPDGPATFKIINIR